MPGTTSRKSLPQAWRSKATSCGEQTTPSRPAAFANRARRRTCASTGPSWPVAARSLASRLVNTVTAKSFVRRAPRASTAARIIASPPALWSVKNSGSSASAARTAPATVLGISCSFRSRKSFFLLPAAMRTPAGPCAAKNSSPSFTPPTAPDTAAMSVRARSRSGVSTAQRIGLWSIGAILPVLQVVERHLRAGEILERMADRLEERDLVVEAPSRAVAARQLEEIARYVEAGDDARRERPDDVARLGLGRFPSIDEYPRAMHRLVIGFAHARRTAADEVDMHAFGQPSPFENRLVGRGCAANDMRAAHRFLEIGGGYHFHLAAVEAPGKPRRFLGIAAPNEHIVNRADARMRLDERRGQSAGADHQEPLAVGTREIGGGERRGCRGSPRRQGRPVKEREQLAGLAVAEQVRAQPREFLRLGFARENRRELDSQMLARLPGGQDDQRAIMALRNRDGVDIGCRSLDATLAKGLAQGLDQRRKSERRDGFAIAQDAHRLGVACAPHPVNCGRFPWSALSALLWQPVRAPILRSGARGAARFGAGFGR